MKLTSFQILVGLFSYFLAFCIYFPLFVLTVTEQAKTYDPYEVGNYVQREILLRYSKEADVVFLASIGSLSNSMLTSSQIINNTLTSEQLDDIMRTEWGSAPIQASFPSPATYEVYLDFLALFLKDNQQNNNMSTVLNNFLESQLIPSGFTEFEFLAEISGIYCDDLYDRINSDIVLSKFDENVDNSFTSAELPTEFGPSFSSGYSVSPLILAIDHFEFFFEDILVVDNKAAMRNYLFPMVIICSCFVIAFSILVFVFRDEPEMKSRYHAYLLQLFFSAYLSCFFMFPFTLGYRQEKDYYMPFYVFFVYFGIFFFFSAINCRNRLMYLLFDNHRFTSLSYFVPWLWHLPVMLLALGLIFCIMVPQYIYFLDDLKVGYFICFTLTLIFFAESLFYTVKTKQQWNLFVDYWQNIRVTASFFLIVCGLTSLALVSSTYYKVKFTQTHICMYACFCITAYLLDALGPAIVKIISRRLNKEIFSDIALEGNVNVIDDVTEIINDEEMSHVLLRFAEKQANDENVLFLMGIYSLTSPNNNSSQAQPQSQLQLQQQPKFFIQNSAVLSQDSERTKGLDISKSITSKTKRKKDTGKDSLGDVNLSGAISVTNPETMPEFNSEKDYIALQVLQNIDKLYLQSNSERQLNLDISTIRRYRAKYASLITSEETTFSKETVYQLYEDAINDISLLIRTNLLSSFKDSSQYREIMNKRVETQKTKGGLVELGMLKDVCLDQDPSLTTTKDATTKEANERNCIATCSNNSNLIIPGIPTSKCPDLYQQQLSKKNSAMKTSMKHNDSLETFLEITPPIPNESISHHDRQGQVDSHSSAEKARQSPIIGSTADTTQT